jgi:hypothetical protein
MNRLILSTTMTVDAVISVTEWYVSEGEHDRAAREQFEQSRGDAARTHDLRRPRSLLVVSDRLVGGRN